MPPVIAAIPAALAAGGLAAVEGTVIFGLSTTWSAIAIGAMTLASGTLSGLMAESARNVAAVSPQALSFNMSSDEQRVWGWGECISGGTCKYWETTGTDNKYLWMVVAFHDTEIDSVTGFYCNEASESFAGTDSTGTFSGVMSRYDKLGTINQAAETNLDSASSRWTSAHTLTNIAYYVWKMTADQTKYASGRPDPKIKFRARKLWDPRATTATITTSASSTFTTSAAHGYAAGDQIFIKDHTGTYTDQFGVVRTIERDWKVYDCPTTTTFRIMKWDGTALAVTAGGSGGTASKMVWTANASLATLDFVIGIRMGGVFIGGMCAPLNALDYDLINAAANTCDENVTLAAGGTEKRYTVNGICGSMEDKKAVLASLLMAMGGTELTRNGKLGWIAGGAITSTMELTDDDLHGGIKVNASRSIQDKSNTITGIYSDPTARDGTASLGAISDPDFITEDGGQVLTEELRSRFTNSGPTMQRLVKIMLADHREQLAIEAVFKPVAAQIPLGGTFTWTSGVAGYTSQKMRLIDRKRQPDGSFRLTARQETDAKYSWSESTEETDPPSFSTHVGFDPASVTAPSSISVTAVAVTGGSSSSIPALQVRVPTSSNPFVRRIITQWKKNADSIWMDGPTISVDFSASYTYGTITGLAPSTSYDVRAAYQTNFGTSSWTTSSANAVGTLDVLVLTTNLSGSITGAQIGSGQVGTTNLANSSVTTPILATDAVTTVKIIDGAVTTGLNVLTVGSVTLNGTTGAESTLASGTFTGSGKPILFLVDGTFALASAGLEDVCVSLYLDGVLALGGGLYGGTWDIGALAYTTPQNLRGSRGVFGDLNTVLDIIVGGSAGSHTWELKAFMPNTPTVNCNVTNRQLYIQDSLK